ncbi:Uncharacterised protein [Mycobacteroides abscessus subsp. massiliense]|nr:Uncharacterised protein [Mycobacteroides abscessus subsp. massiliense]
MGGPEPVDDNDHLIPGPHLRGRQNASQQRGHNLCGWGDRSAVDTALAVDPDPNFHLARGQIE